MKSSLNSMARNKMYRTYQVVPILRMNRYASCPAKAKLLLNGTLSSYLRPYLSRSSFSVGKIWKFENSVFFSYNF